MKKFHFCFAMTIAAATAFGVKVGTHDFGWAALWAANAAIWAFNTATQVLWLSRDKTESGKLI